MSGGGWSSSCCDKTDGRERIADMRDEMQQTMEQSAGIYRYGDALAEAADKLRELQERFRHVALEDHSRTFNTELIAALELSLHARRGRDDRAVALCAARNRAARTSAPTSPAATTSAFSPIPWPTATPTARAGSSICR